MNQLSIDFDPDIVNVYERCVDLVAARVHQQGVPQKAIAADMDYAPSQLTQKLGNNTSSSARFTLDDLEKFIDVTGDIEPIRYLVSKYLAKETLSEVEALRARIAKLESEKFS